MDRRPLFGVWIKSADANYFISDPKQALPEHAAAAKAAWAKGSVKKQVLYSANGIEIKAARVYADVAPYVILKDIAPQEYDLGIFQTKWTPEASRPLECDYKGRNRFAVLDFASNASEAIAIVNILKGRE